MYILLVMNLLMTITCDDSLSTSKLENHMNSASSLHVIGANLKFILKLLATEDQSDLLDINAFFLLECLFDLKDGVLSVEVEALLTSCQGFDH